MQHVSVGRLPQWNAVSPPAASYLSLLYHFSSSPHSMITDTVSHLQCVCLHMLVLSRHLVCMSLVLSFLQDDHLDSPVFPPLVKQWTEEHCVLQWVNTSKHVVEVVNLAREGKKDL